MATARKLPSRLHHTAYVSKNLEATRKFYEDLIGLPLMATWCESDMLFGAERTYCHLFFGLADGGALAFFQFAQQVGPGAVRPEDAGIAVPSHRAQGRRATCRRRSSSACTRRATRSRRHSCSSTATAARCTSVDPDGMICEFTVDHPDVEKINATRRTDAHAELKRWLAGDHHSNNMYR